MNAVITLPPGAAAGEADLRSYCRERLAAHRYPRVFEFRDVLPKNTSAGRSKTSWRPAGPGLPRGERGQGKAERWNG